MRRLSTIFLIVFLVLLAGLGGMVAFKDRPRPEPVAAPPQEADYRIKEIHIDETLEGNLRWQLDADQAEVFEQEKQTLLRQVTVTVFNQDRVWTVKGDEGVLHNETRDVTLTGNVVVTSSDGLSLTAPDLRWENEARRLSTDGAVTIRRAGTTITGRGLEVEMAAERALLGAKVRVVITDGRNTQLGLFPRGGS
ncbi:MAG: LPS export ABC transporter periplasmic protein LptC [Candidatus Rokubacteria bacterium]|nr:LPS export ABC transporter periplasmic protein LptC [Candidatus Rokubacteria bacterium]